MLHAIDIVLICLGAALSVLALFGAFMLLAVRWRKTQSKQKHRQTMVANKDYYCEQQPPSKYDSFKNGATLKTIVEEQPKSATVVGIRLNEGDDDKIPNGIANDVVVLKIDEQHDFKSHEEVHRGAHSIKRSHRPCRIKLSPDLATAAHAEAVQTRHTVDTFLDDLNKIQHGDDAVIYEEFQILEAWDAAREKSCSAAEKARTRNRFIDILPNDETRVILRGPNDYINASLIDGYHEVGQFIATQGPIGPEETTDGRKESTVDDFWRMIWEKNVQCIVMLTDCVENIRQRCSRYWPPLGEAHRFGELEIDLVSESEDPICTHRELDIRKEGHLRQVSQYHFLNWRDAKGPESATCLLDFVERVMQKNYRKPIVVHCSAGVGRTGVLIALWILLETARHEQVIDIFGTVDTLRQQRSRMVQTPEQYISLYEVMALAIEEKRI